MKKFVIFLLFIVICTGYLNPGKNPNTAISGASDYYITLDQNTTGVYLSNPEIYDAMGESFTVELWFRKNVGNGCYRNIMSKHVQQPGTIENYDNGYSEFMLGVQWNGALNFFTGCGTFEHFGYYVDVNQPHIYPAVRNTPVVDYIWTHIAVTVDWKEDEIGIPTGIAKMFVDGVLVDAEMWASIDPVCFGRKRTRAVGQPFRIGYYDNQDPGAQIWIGDIDEVRIWNVCRSDEDIKKYYEGGLPPYSPGLISYHTFAEGSGMYSYNIVAGSLGIPQVVLGSPFPSGWQFWKSSDLKLSPNPGVACQGYTVTGQFYQQGNGDIYITHLIWNTDAQLLWSDNRNPIPANIRKPITKADLPLNIGNNLVEYVPGKVVGLDIIYYEARNNGTFPEPGGPARIYFETKCCGSIVADNCRVCGGNGEDCAVSCDHMGGVRDYCGVCNGDSSSCKGCDNRLFSLTEYDACGVCGGNGQDCNPPCNGTIDQCGVCNGNNSCCVAYKGVSVKEMDFVLLHHFLNDTISQINAISTMIDSYSQFVGTSSNLITQNSQLTLQLANFIISLNNFCGSTDEVISILDSFLTSYGENILVQWPLLTFPFIVN